MDKEKIHQILSSLWKNDESVGKTYYNQALQDVQTAIDLQEEPVSEDLEEAAHKYADLRMSNYETAFYAFMSGANWQKEQFEKNRLAACDKQRDEEAEIESDFVMGIIENEHRQPTFDDAIKYGMRLQKEQMMAKAIDAQVLENYDGKVIRYDETIFDEKLSDCKVFDKVKVIIIKED